LDAASDVDAVLSLEQELKVRRHARFEGDATHQS